MQPWWDKRHNIWKKAALVTLVAMLSGWSGACDEQTDDAVYVHLNLDTTALERLKNGHAALTFVAEKNDGELCGPGWGSDIQGWSSREECKDDWKEISEVETAYTWKIDAKGQYKWVLVLLELFDDGGRARYRQVRTVTFGQGAGVLYDVAGSDLCDPLLPGRCCDNGRASSCGDGSFASTISSSGFVGWCTDSIDHSPCSAIVAQSGQD